MFTAKREMLLNPDPEQIARLFIFSRKNIDFQAVMQFVFRLNDKNIHSVTELNLKLLCSLV